MKLQIHLFNSFLKTATPLFLNYSHDVRDQFWHLPAGGDIGLPVLRSNPTTPWTQLSPLRNFLVYVCATVRATGRVYVCNALWEDEDQRVHVICRRKHVTSKGVHFWISERLCSCFHVCVWPVCPLAPLSRQVTFSVCVPACRLASRTEPCGAPLPLSFSQGSGRCDVTLGARRKRCSGGAREVGSPYQVFGSFSVE